MLADYLKISPSHLSRVVKGERPTERPLLEEIAGFFDVSLADLVSGTEYEDFAVPGRGSVGRATYEQLLQRLREAMSAAEVADANLAGERERSAQLETQLATAGEEARKATARVEELEGEARKSARERKECAGRIKSLQVEVDELIRAKESLEERVQ